MNKNRGRSFLRILLQPKFHVWLGYLRQRKLKHPESDLLVLERLRRNYSFVSGISFIRRGSVGRWDLVSSSQETRPLCFPRWLLPYPDKDIRTRKWVVFSQTADVVVPDLDYPSDAVGPSGSEPSSPPPGTWSVGWSFCSDPVPGTSDLVLSFGSTGSLRSTNLVYEDKTPTSSLVGRP